MDEPLSSQQFIQEYNSKRAYEEELIKKRQKLLQCVAELRTMPQNTSLFHLTGGTI